MYTKVHYALSFKKLLEINNRQNKNKYHVFLEAITRVSSLI